jgi:hypothetical protein
MLATMLQDFACELEAQVEQWAQELGRTLDLAKLEEELSERMQRLYAEVVEGRCSPSCSASRAV